MSMNVSPPPAPPKDFELITSKVGDGSSTEFEFDEADFAGYDQYLLIYRKTVGGGIICTIALGDTTYETTDYDYTFMSGTSISTATNQTSFPLQASTTGMGVYHFDKGGDRFLMTGNVSMGTISNNGIVRAMNNVAGAGELKKLKLVNSTSNFTTNCYAMLYGLRRE